MIQFLAKMYNETAQEYVDNSFRMYTIAQYTASWSQYDNPFINHEGQTLTDIPATAFATGSNNIGLEFEYAAKQYYHAHSVWPILKLCTSDSTSSYYLLWDHNSPNSLQINGGGGNTAWQSILQWDDSIDTSQEAPRYNTVNSRVFVTAGSSQELEAGLVFGGAFRTDTDPVQTLIAYNGFTLIYPPGALVHDQGTQLFRNNGYGNITKASAGDAISVMFTNGTDVDYRLIAPTVSGTWLAPWNGSGSYRYALSIENVTIGSVQIKLTGNGYPATNRELLTGIIVGSKPTDPAEKLSAAGIEVAYNKNTLKDYLNPPNPPTPPVPPGPDPSDVDPDNPPDPDEPPEPIPPDDQDPYYDPTSDPDSPEYDPTKDPDSPEYDPSEPDTPHRPPSTEDGGDPPVKPPVDPVTPPPTPPSHAINSRFVTLYTPSLSQLNALAEYLWSPAWSIDGFKKIFANPMDCILGLMIFPALAAPSGSKEVNVGNLSTGVTMSYIDNQYVEVNCGSFEITEYYASYLDYDPYTKIEIYLPYIGTHRLSADDVMAKTIQLKYMIDLLSGACVAFLVVDGTTLYTFTGSCATPIPVSGNDWSNMVNGILSVAGAATAAVISGGTAATMAAGALASTSLFVSSHKEHIRHGGSVASAAGLMSIQTPYLIVTRPRQALPIGQNSFQGYPSFMTESLGSLTGYTEVESCHLEHIPCTDEELKEIERLLKGGVLF